MAQVTNTVSFKKMVQAVGYGHHNIPTELYIDLEEVIYSVLLVSNRSLGERRMVFAKGGNPVFIPEYPGEEEGWWLATAGDLEELFVASATSGTSVLAKLLEPIEGLETPKGGWWEVTLTYDPEYVGVYASTYFYAVGGGY